MGIKYKELMKTINSNICGDGYDSDIRAENILTKCKNEIDKAYQQGRADAINELIIDYCITDNLGCGYVVIDKATLEHLKEQTE